MSKKFPYTAWKLTPGFKPVEVVITDECAAVWNSDEPAYFVSESGEYHALGDVFEDRASAIAGGLRRLIEQEAGLAKKAANIAKKRAALVKAEASA